MKPKFKICSGLVALAAVFGVSAATGTASADTCPNAQYRTGPSAQLPDCRAYEQVSEPNKGSGGVGAGGEAFPVSFYVTPDGQNTIYPADSAFLGVEYFQTYNTYFAQRSGAGWGTLPIGWAPFRPPEAASGSPIPHAMGLSDDGTTTVVISDRDPQTGQEIPVSFFRVNLQTGESVRLTGETYDSGLSYVIREYDAEGDASYANAFLTSNIPLLQEVRDAIDDGDILQDDTVLYHYSNGEGISVASKYGGAVQNGELSYDLNNSGIGSYPKANYIAEDGRAFVYYDRSNTIGRALFRGEAAGGSTFVNESENPAVTTPGTAFFMGADAEANRIFFLSQQQLLPEDTNPNPDLYLYDHLEPAGDRLTLISEDLAGNPGGADVRRAHGSSDDGSTIYFTAATQILPGEPNDPGDKLYRWQNGTVTYVESVATISASAISPSGQYLMYATTRSGGVDVAPFGQAFVYDAATGDRTCVSCAAGGVSTSPVALDYQASQSPISNEPRRRVTDQGQVFFDTSQRVLNRDTNGVRDVYGWKDGKTSLISSGRNPFDSRFADASEDGSSVFFMTREQLVASDFDDQPDLYTARINGGLASEQQSIDAPCVATACQGPPAPEPEQPSLGSTDLRSTGTVRPSKPVRIGARIQRRAAVGTVKRVRVRVPSAGRVVIRGRAVRRAARRLPDAGNTRLNVRLRPKALRALVRRGALRTRARVVFRAVDGGGARRNLVLTFRTGADR